ncbi:MAG: bifunctional diaminohydroxyphosphoribosylaminopyrimidine deaminase/5-amino-6-(5-phosphoribosylamino)uracil reductase RibD, partial [Litoreibacter sp.]|nr:bifunctional diaminohydroxyphosphoribosylaminopyrimidine deaminase/5-amino-6-(5-phosphoribosylamino)uracil reductase RibD [Litoreibacter sp.]
MTLALSLGRRGQGRVWPNPAVGCVLVKDGRVLARGWTQDGGRPHAERHALDQVGEAACGATAYVTLEPCAHTGKTPPCCDALIEAGVARVVVACGDPDPRVAGRGLQRMRDAGIEVTTGVLEPEAKRDHTGFLNRITQNRPFVTLKLAQSLDGRIATSTGQSQWITGPAARRRVHAMRASHDAVMVGAGTARADLPSLTVRGLGVDRQPVRVVLSNNLDLPREGPLFESARDVPVWLIHSQSASESARTAWTGAGAKLLQVEGKTIGIGQALNMLAAEGLTRVFCEGGGGLAASLIKAECVDELVVFNAGMVLGGDGLAATAPLGLDQLSEAAGFALDRV